MEELDGIKELIVGYIAGKKRVKMGELATYLSLDEKIVWEAIKSLQDDGAVFMPDDFSVSLIEKL